MNEFLNQIEPDLEGFLAADPDAEETAYTMVGEEAALDGGAE